MVNLLLRKNWEVTKADIMYKNESIVVLLGIHRVKPRINAPHWVESFRKDRNCLLIQRPMDNAYRSNTKSLPGISFCKVSR